MRRLHVVVRHAARCQEPLRLDEGTARKKNNLCLSLSIICEFDQDEGLPCPPIPLLLSCAVTQFPSLEERPGRDGDEQKDADGFFMKPKHKQEQKRDHVDRSIIPILRCT